MKTGNLPFGSRVRVKATLHRTAVGERSLIWERSEEYERPLEGILIGYRNRHDGRMEWERDEWSGVGGRSECYVATRGYKTALVAIDLKTNPVVALPDDVELITDNVFVWVGRKDTVSDERNPYGVETE